LKSISDESVEAESDGNPLTLSPIDQVVLAMGLKPRDELDGILKNLQIPHAVIGDARRPRRIIEAVEEGAWAAWDL